MAEITLNRALIVNDELSDDTKQLGTGEEALDGDGYAVVTVVRSALAPTAADVRQKGQLWHRITDDALYWSRGAGLWSQVRDVAAALQAHQATHRPGGVDALPWTTILGSGLITARPAAAASNAGYWYDATDTKQIFRSTGAAWVEVGLSALAQEYTHSQGSPATAWVVNHGLGRYPKAVQVLDTALTAILAPYQHITTNQLIVTFGRPATGTCIVG